MKKNHVKSYRKNLNSINFHISSFAILIFIWLYFHQLRNIFPLEKTSLRLLMKIKFCCLVTLNSEFLIKVIKFTFQFYWIESLERNALDVKFSFSSTPEAYCAAFVQCLSSITQKLHYSRRKRVHPRIAIVQLRIIFVVHCERGTYREIITRKKVVALERLWVKICYTIIGDICNENSILIRQQWCHNVGWAKATTKLFSFSPFPTHFQLSSLFCCNKGKYSALSELFILWRDFQVGYWIFQFLKNLFP